MANLKIKDQKKITARVEKKSDIKDGTMEIVLSFKDESFSFAPGQYVWVELPKLYFPSSESPRRAFSIASDSAIKNRLSIIFRKSESVYKKTLASLPIGSIVSIIGPCGGSMLNKDISKPIIFIGGGTGIAPFFSIILNQISQKTNRQIDLFYFNETENRAPYLEELKKISEENSFIKLHLFFGQLKIDDLLKDFQKANISAKETNWYISGPKGMIDVITQILTQIKIPAEFIHYEENYPSTNNIVDNKINLFDQIEIFKQAVDQSSNHIIFTDENGIIKFANSAAEHMTGYSLAEMLGQTPRLWGGIMEASFYKTLWDTIKIKRQSFFGKIKNRRKDGTYYFAFARISPLIDSSGVLIGFIGTEEDITESENIDLAKTEFISLASHQLRTPVVALGWYLEMLEGKKDDFKKLSFKQKKYIREIHDINKHMLDLVSTLLDISRLELGTAIIKQLPTDLVSIAKATLLELGPEINKKKISVTTKFEKKLKPFITDPKIAGIIFQNLLTNAVKYIPVEKAGKIFISINYIEKGQILNLKKITTDSILISVKDNGMGIPFDQKNEIFSRMFRADNAREKEQNGNGLGLYMVKKVVESISGEIWFESEEGKGSTFYVTLPGIEPGLPA